MPSDLGYAVTRAEGLSRQRPLTDEDIENLKSLGKGAITSPFTLAPDAIGGLQGLLRWTESGEPIFDNPISGDPIREAVNLDPQDPWGWAGEFLDPTSGALKFMAAMPAIIKGGKGVLKAKRFDKARRLLPFDDAFQVADTNAVVRKAIYKHPVLKSSIEGWSVQVPAEVERKTIKILSPRRAKSGRRREIEVLKNPDAQTLRRFVQTHTPDSWVDMGNVYGQGYEGALRYFKDADGNWYFWDGSEAIHWHVWKQLHPDKASLFDTAAVHKITQPFSERLLTKDDIMKGRFTTHSEWALLDDDLAGAAPRYDPDNIEVFKEVGPGFENYQTAIDHLESNAGEFARSGVKKAKQAQPDTDILAAQQRQATDAAEKAIAEALDVLPAEPHRLDIKGFDFRNPNPDHQKFLALADSQRGAPEKAMLRAQDAMGGGVMQTAVEHVGDLTHRMSEWTAIANGDMGFEYVKPKVDRSLNLLRSRYGFGREFQENIASNARFAKEHGYKPVSMEGATEALRAYADEHRKLFVYNDMQRAARDAAVALGEQRFDDAVKELEKLESVLKQGREAWTDAASIVE
jgi:hypothetical protein